jgi:carboxyl-terminal processing protease
MPDIIVKSDTSDYSDYWAELSRRGILAEFVVDYLDMHRSELESQFSTDDQFVEEFEVGDEMIESLVVFAEGRGIARNDEELAISRRSIAEITKALIAQRLWDSTAYFKVVNRTNNIVKRALETLSVK